jgi:hypothetical protein
MIEVSFPAGLTPAEATLREASDTSTYNPPGDPLPIHGSRLSGGLGLLSPTESD